MILPALPDSALSYGIREGLITACTRSISNRLPPARATVNNRAHCAPPVPHMPSITPWEIQLTPYSDEPIKRGRQSTPGYTTGVKTRQKFNPKKQPN